MNTSIILYENGDVSLFQTEQDMLLYIEPIDVDNNEYIAFDSNGYEIQLFVENNNIKMKKTEDNKSQELRSILINFLINFTPISELSILNLEQLINKLHKTIGFTK